MAVIITYKEMLALTEELARKVCAEENVDFDEFIVAIAELL